MVHVVDDDAAVRDSLSLLLESAGFQVTTFDSAESFMASCGRAQPCCLVLDVHMPSMSGLDLQEQLASRRPRCPIIFLTAYGDIQTTVRAMKAGAADFLSKPVEGKVLIERVQAAIERSRAEHERQGRIDRLTEREREILRLALAGHPNKEIARQLRISHRTVEVHRSRILAKCEATSLLELAYLSSGGL